MAALPGQIASTYLAYKQDTSIFLSWLHSASKDAGWKRKTQPKEQLLRTKGPRLEGKARKEAKEAEAAEKAKAAATSKSCKYTFTIVEIIEQIEVVQRAGPSTSKRMPLWVQRSLERAIQARERVTPWYTKVAEAGTNSPRAMDGHAFFTDMVLKKALNSFASVRHAAPSSEGGEAFKSHDDAATYIKLVPGPAEVERDYNRC